MIHLKEHYINSLNKSQRIDEFLATGAILAGALVLYGLNGGGQDGNDWFINSIKKIGGGIFKGITTAIGVVSVGIGAFLYKSFTTKGQREKEEQGLQRKVDDKKEEIEHEKKMKELQDELDRLNGKTPTDSDIDNIAPKIQSQQQANTEAGFSDYNLTAMIAKELENSKDPKQKESQKGMLDILRCKNSSETPDNWLSENVSEDDLQGLIKNVNKSMEGTNFNDAFKESIQKSASTISEDDVKTEKEISKSVYNDLGKKMEADAAKRKGYKTEIEQKLIEQQTELSKLDKRIMSAENDKDKLQIKIEKLKYQKESDALIYKLKEEAAHFELICESSTILNKAIPGRQERCEKNVKSVQEEANQKSNQYEKSLKDLGVETTEKPEEEPAKKPEEEPAKKPEEEPAKKSEEGPAKKPEGNQDKKSKSINPAQKWHKKRNKHTGKPSKNYYDKQGNSISPQEFKQKMTSFKKRKSQNESLTSFSQWLRESFD